MTHNNYIYIAVMALVSYAIRILPLTLIRKPIKNRFIQSFLYYVPYVTLAVMTFPAIIQATQSPAAGAVALVVGIAAAWFGASLFQVAAGCCAVVFVLLSEMYPTKVRGLAMSIAGFALWIGTYLIGQLTPWMLQNLTPAGTFFLFAVMCVSYMLIVWKLVPETTGKSLEEIERYWTRSEQ